MSALARSYPDQPDMWANPPVPPARPRRRCWCGTTVTASSTCGCCCLDHDDPKDAS